MGILSNLKAKYKEKKAFRGIVSNQNTQAARQAFADESKRVAIKRARAMARGEKVDAFGRKMVPKKITTKCPGFNFNNLV